MRQAGLLPPKNANLTPGDRRFLVETMDKLAMLSRDNQKFVAEMVDKLLRSER